MPIKVTNKQVKVHTDYFDFCQRWSLEKAEYEKAKISVDDKPHRFNSTSTNKSKGDLAEADRTWPRFPITEELDYYNFLDKITDSKQNRFYPARDEDRRPIPKTGAMKITTDILRLKTGDNEEFLLTKSYIIGHDAAGEEVSFYLPFSEKWIKTLFEWRNEYNNSTKSFDKICLGPNDGIIQYQLPFNKENALELFKQRASDLVNFIVKDEVSQEARMVEKDVNSQKTFERFSNNSFDFLWSGEYIPIQVRAELRQEAVARGYIKGGAGDFQPPSEPAKGGKNAYQ
jgi:hypothetical protein